MKAIYGIINKLNGNQYVGSAKNFYNRKRTHLQQLKKGNHHSLYLQRAWLKYGEENFTFLILEKVDSNNLIEREQWWIDNSNSKYNVRKIANSNLGRKFGKEARKNMSLAHLGEIHPEWRRKQKSEYTKGDKHWTKKKNYSDKAKKNMSKAQKNLYKKGYEHPNKKPIIQMDLEGNFIKEWDCAATAAKKLNLKRQTIVANLTGKNKKSRNFLWKYKIINNE